MQINTWHLLWLIMHHDYEILNRNQRRRVHVSHGTALSQVLWLHCLLVSILLGFMQLPYITRSQNGLEGYIIASLPRGLVVAPKALLLVSVKNSSMPQPQPPSSSSVKQFAILVALELSAATAWAVLMSTSSATYHGRCQLQVEKWRLIGGIDFLHN